MFTDEAVKLASAHLIQIRKAWGSQQPLTEIFGLPSSPDPETQREVDERNALARIDRRTESQEKQLIEMNDKLSRLWFMFA